MVLTYHVIFGAYGFWLPNDPRGSWSDFVGAWELLLAAGKTTRTHERKSLASEPHDSSARLRAKESLKYDPVHFDGLQARCVAGGFHKAIAEADYKVFACSILPEHVHLVIGRCERKAERIAGHLKARATQQLTADNIHPLKEFGERNTVPTPWAERCWKVFLNQLDDVQLAIRYVEDNPVKEGKRPQRWSFVVPFVPW